jgi:type IV secretory pathway component VirB8
MNTWNSLLFTADILVQKGCLNETQLALIIDLVDLKKLVKYNKLSKDFIEKYVVPRINYDDYDDIDLYDIEKYQSRFNPA